MVPVCNCLNAPFGDRCILALLDFNMDGEIVNES